MDREELKEKARALPLKPGVYIMMDAEGTVIYVGKAKALKNRVSQYFQDSAAHTDKTRLMVSQIDRFDVIVADSEFEALVLECSLIKRHQPHFNILLKDDKGYPYLRVSVQDEYPRFSIAGRTAVDGARYFGPYGGRKNTQEIISALQEALRLPACARKFPRDIGKERPCLNFHMGKCDGYCRPEMERERHAQAIGQALRLLEGKFAEVSRELNDEMERAAEDLLFERAAQLRDRIRAIELLGKRQKVVSGAFAERDVVGYHAGVAKSAFVVLHYTGGELASKDWELLQTPLDETREDIVSSLVKQYYGRRGHLPREILLPCAIEDAEPLEQMLGETAGHRVHIVTPQRGAKVALVSLANTNAEEEVVRATTREEQQNKLLEELGRLLGLPGAPARIEAFDISNTGASEIVASMTVFQGGRPLKRDYRHFKLRDMAGPDDYASMEQVLTRRFQRQMDGDEKFGAMPDLLLMDGGAGQTGVAERVLAGFGLSVPVFGMVKDDRHRTRALVTAGNHEIGIRHNPALFALIGRIQEETHRFAITFHRARRAKSGYASVLDEVEGVGKARKAALLKHFKSLKAIRAATEEELAAVVPKPAAVAVYRALHPEGQASAGEQPPSSQ